MSRSFEAWLRPQLDQDDEEAMLMSDMLFDVCRIDRGKYSECTESDHGTVVISGECFPISTCRVFAKRRVQSYRSEFPRPPPGMIAMLARPSQKRIHSGSLQLHLKRVLSLKMAVFTKYGSSLKTLREEGISMLAQRNVPF